MNQYVTLLFKVTEYRQWERERENLIHLRPNSKPAANINGIGHNENVTKSKLLYCVTLCKH